MNWSNIAKWTLTVPWIVAWIDFLTNQPLVDNIMKTKDFVGEVLHAWNTTINPLFSTVAWVASAWLLTNSILKDIWLKDKKVLRWILSSVAWWLAFSAWSVATPYLVAWWLSYAIWKHWWKYWVEALNRLGWAAYWLIWWAVKWAKNWVLNWIKWKQFEWEWLWRLNPKI